MFNTQIKDIGIVKQSTTHTVEYDYIGNGVIRRLDNGEMDISKSDCTCQVQEYNPTLKKMVITVTPKQVPQYRLAAGFNDYSYNKTVVVTFIESNVPKQYILSIKATVTL